MTGESAQIRRPVEPGSVTLSDHCSGAAEIVSEQPPSRLKQLLYRALAGLFLALAAAGVFLPILPTTPFVIVAAWAAGRSSPELRERLRNHPRYGPSLRAWQDHGAVSRRAKTSAIALMFLSWMIVWWTAPISWVPVGVGILLCVVGGYLLSRPTPPRVPSSDYG